MAKTYVLSETQLEMLLASAIVQADRMEYSGLHEKMVASKTLLQKVKAEIPAEAILAEYTKPNIETVAPVAMIVDADVGHPGILKLIGLPGIEQYPAGTILVPFE